MKKSEKKLCNDGRVNRDDVRRARHSVYLSSTYGEYATVIRDVERIESDHLGDYAAACTAILAYYRSCTARTADRDERIQSML